MSIDLLMENLEENNGINLEANAQSTRIKSSKRKTGRDDAENGQSTFWTTQKTTTNEQRYIGIHSRKEQSYTKIVRKKITYINLSWNIMNIYLR